MHTILLFRMQKLKYCGVCNISVTSALHMPANLLFDSQHSREDVNSRHRRQSGRCSPFVENLPAIIQIMVIIKARSPKATASHVCLVSVPLCRQVIIYEAKPRPNVSHGGENNIRILLMVEISVIPGEQTLTGKFTVLPTEIFTSLKLCSIICQYFTVTRLPNWIVGV